MEANIFEATQRGHFGYEGIQPNLIIPYTYRISQRLCDIKVFLWHLSQQTIGLDENFKDFRFLKGYKMHGDESRLWDEIKYFHNDTVYNAHISYQNTSLIRMEDVRTVFRYIDDIKRKMLHGAQSKIACGMVRIWLPTTKLEIIWPYVLKNGQRFIPLNFPFVSKTPAATTLIDIDVLYMRFVINVMKVNWPIGNFQLPCALLDDEVEHLRTKTNGNFEYTDEYWPSKEPNYISESINNNRNDLPALSSGTNDDTSNIEPEVIFHMEFPKKKNIHEINGYFCLKKGSAHKIHFSAIGRRSRKYGR